MDYWLESTTKKILDLKIKRGIVSNTIKEMEQKLFQNTQIVERDGLQEICEAWFEYKREKKSTAETVDQLNIVAAGVGHKRRESAMDTESDDADKISQNPQDVEELTKIIKKRQLEKEKAAKEKPVKKKTAKKGQKDLEEAAKKAAAEREASCDSAHDSEELEVEASNELNQMFYTIPKPEKFVL